MTHLEKGVFPAEARKTFQALSRPVLPEDSAVLLAAYRERSHPAQRRPAPRQLIVAAIVGAGVVGTTLPSGRLGGRGIRERSQAGKGHIDGV